MLQKKKKGALFSGHIIVPNIYSHENGVLSIIEKKNFFFFFTQKGPILSLNCENKKFKIKNKNKKVFFLQKQHILYS